MDILKDTANLHCSILTDISNGEHNSDLDDTSDGAGDGDTFSEAEDTSEYDSEEGSPGLMPAGWERLNNDSSESDDSGNE